MDDPAIQSLVGTHQVSCSGPVRLAVRRDWVAALPLRDMLAGAPIRSWGQPLPHDYIGRASIDVLDTAAGALVAKALTRGGVLGPLLPDRFVNWRRPWAEALLAEQLSARGCPTPPVVVVRSTAGPGGLHRLELATARVEGAVDLLEALRSQADPRPLAALAGRTLRKLHDAGLRHRDLQVKNLLVRGDGAPVELAWVIDLDRCRLGQALGQEPRLASLTRFTRSLVKRGVLPATAGQGAVPWSACRAFLQEYGGLDGLSAAALSRRLRGRLARQLRWRGWSRRPVLVSGTGRH